MSRRIEHMFDTSADVTTEGLEALVGALSRVGSDASAPSADAAMID
jgi:hypothetical protein